MSRVLAIFKGMFILCESWFETPRCLNPTGCTRCEADHTPRSFCRPVIGPAAVPLLDFASLIACIIALPGLGTLCLRSSAEVLFCFAIHSQTSLVGTCRQRPYRRASLCRACPSHHHPRNGCPSQVCRAQARVFPSLVSLSRSSLDTHLRAVSGLLLPLFG